MIAIAADIEKNVQLMFCSSSVNRLVTALESKDPCVQGHSNRVSDIAVKIARYKWGDCPEIKDLQLAGRLHDIGKLGIPDAILNKAGSLTSDEFDRIKQHPVIGEKIIQPINSLKSIARAIRHHHERFSGGGYPDGLNGELIPENSRILAIADSYDAMTSARPYRPPMESSKAVQEIERCAGSQFSPEWAEVFLQLFHGGTMAVARS